MSDLLAGFDRLRLSGDEDCGVGLHCNECWRGGRPLAYLTDGAQWYADDPEVTVVFDFAALVMEGRRHLDAAHQR